MKKSADQILKNMMDMAPKNNFESLGESAVEKVDEADLQEIRAVDESLDELSNALDCFEQRTDNIIEQLKELLHSNREIRQELAQENAAAEIPTSQTPPKNMNMEASECEKNNVSQQNGSIAME